jgi:hypothetical protein
MLPPEHREPPSIRPPRTFASNWVPGLSAVIIAPLLMAVLVQTRLIAISSTDVGLYRWWGEAIASGAVPFRDVRIEYPPAAVILFVLPALVTSSYVSYAVVFAAIVGTVGMAGLLLAARIGTMLERPSRDSVIGTLAAAGMIGLLGAVALTRFDFVPAALTVAALFVLLRERIAWAGALLGAAVAVKLYPAVMIPVVATYVLRRSGKRSLAVFLGVTAVVIAGTFIPFLLASPRGVQDSIGMQIGRALEIESTGASLLWLAREAGVADWPEQVAYFELNFRAAEVVAVGSTVVGAIVLALLWWLHARGRATRMRLLRYGFASVTTFLVFAKVLSPQYLLWLVLLAPTLRAAGGRLAVALLALAVLASAIYFPRWFTDVGADLAPQWLAVIALRNLLLGALLVVLVWGDTTVDMPERQAALS